MIPFISNALIQVFTCTSFGNFFIIYKIQNLFVIIWNELWKQIPSSYFPGATSILPREEVSFKSEFSTFFNFKPLQFLWAEILKNFETRRPTCKCIMNCIDPKILPSLFFIPQSFSLFLSLSLYHTNHFSIIVLVL